MSEFIEILSPSALKELQTANAEIVKMISNVKVVNDNMIGAKTPSGSDGALKSITSEYQKQEKALANTEKALERARLAEIKLQLAREKAFDKYDANLAKEQAKLKASESLYNKVQAKLNLLSAEYKNLATKKELSISLTDKEASRYTFLQGKIQTYDKTLKAVDATMGKHQRNVGNYASGFNPLTNSINQLTREMPAFTYSVQTGFMALSNNIPIFTDAISNAITQNKELVKQGKPTTSVLSQLLGAFASWQTAMGIGITLLTVYGKEIGEFIGGLMKGSRQLQTIGDQINQLTEARKSASELASKEISELDRLYKVSQDLTLSIDQRKQAVDKLQELYPNYLGNIKDENILNGKAELMYYKLRDAILAKYTAQAIGDKLAENAKEGLEDFLELQQKIVDTENEIIRLRTTGNDLVQKGSAQEKTQTITISNTELIIAQERLLAKLKKDMLLLKDSEREKNGLLIKTMEELLQKSKGLEITEEKSTKNIKANTTAKKENNEVTKESIEYLEGSVEWFEKQISKLKELQKQTAVSSEEWKFFDDVIKDLQTSIDIITGKAEVLGTTFEDAIKKVDFSDVVSAGVTDAVKGLETLNKDWKDTFNDIASVTLDAINTVQQAQQRATEKSLSDLQKQRDIAIMFAGDSADAKAEIDRQYEEKRRVILNKQAQQEKQLAIFSSIINTASAVISALKTGIPMAIAVGAIGLAQTALIASQQVPQFWKGTDNAPEGWALTQERGAEVILDKKGKVKSMGNNKGAQMTYLNQGDKVLNASKSVIFNKELNSILNNNSILPPQIINNSLSDSQFKQGINELKSTISNKSEWSYISDRQGERIYRKEQNTRSQLLSNRLRIK